MSRPLRLLQAVTSFWPSTCNDDVEDQLRVLKSSDKFDVIIDPAMKRLRVKASTEEDLEQVLGQLGTLGDIDGPKVLVRRTIHTVGEGVGNSSKESITHPSQTAYCQVSVSPQPDSIMPTCEGHDQIRVRQSYLDFSIEGLDHFLQEDWAYLKATVLSIGFDDSPTEESIQSASIDAVQKAFRKASPFELEPFMTVEVTCPPKEMTAVIRNVSERHGSIDSLGGGENVRTLKFVAPLRTTLGYSKWVSAQTSGRGSVVSQFLRYAPSAH